MRDRAAIIRGCTAELYRYRLAAKDQWQRIQLAIQEVRRERERISKDEFELLFAPSMTSEAFHQQLEATHDRDIPVVWRLKTESEFLLAAVYGIATMAKAIRSASDGDVNACVQVALARFNRVAPDVGRQFEASRARRTPSSIGPGRGHVPVPPLVAALTSSPCSWSWSWSDQ